MALRARRRIKAAVAAQGWVIDSLEYKTGSQRGWYLVAHSADSKEAESLFAATADELIQLVGGLGV